MSALFPVIRTKTEVCPTCKVERSFTQSRSCGVYLCDECDYHLGLARCYCGWSVSGCDGYRELEEMGETIEPEDY